MLTKEQINRWMTTAASPHRMVSGLDEYCPPEFAILATSHLAALKRIEELEDLCHKRLKQVGDEQAHLTVAHKARDVAILKAINLEKANQHLEAEVVETAKERDEARASLAALVQAAQDVVEWKAPQMSGYDGEMHSMYWCTGSNGERDYFRERLSTVLADIPAAAQALLEELEQERSINATSVKAAGNYTKQIDVLQAQLREAEGVNAQLRHALKSLPERDATAKLEAVRKVADDLRLMDNEYNRKHHQTAIDSALEVADDIDAALAEKPRWMQ